jgi:L1 cell adhesion molecule like protein
LGGEDFDNEIVKYLARDFKDKYNFDLSQDPRALRRLRSAAEQAKKTLSSQLYALIELDCLYKGIDY